jgi:hypothetical protein
MCFLVDSFWGFPLGVFFLFSWQKLATVHGWSLVKLELLMCVIAGFRPLLQDWWRQHLHR